MFIIILLSGGVTYPRVLAFVRLSQEALEFEPNLGCKGNPILNINNLNNQMNGVATQDPCSQEILNAITTTTSDHSTVTTKTISAERVRSLSTYPNREQLLMLHLAVGCSGDPGGLWVSQL